MKEIAIKEIFYSIQGEGFYAGTPSVFIRTAGCNLTCDFCDTDFSLKQKMSPSLLLEAIKDFPSRQIVITGGEPTLQAEALTPFIQIAHKQGYYITLETNGTSIDTMGVDWVTVSPKTLQGGQWLLKKGDELKLVFEGQNLSEYKSLPFKYFFLQPKEVNTLPFGKGVRDKAKTHIEWNKTIEAVKANPHWKLSFQIHKELQIR